MSSKLLHRSTALDQTLGLRRCDWPNRNAVFVDSCQRNLQRILLTCGRAGRVLITNPLLPRASTVHDNKGTALKTVSRCSGSRDIATIDSRDLDSSAGNPDRVSVELATKSSVGSVTAARQPDEWRFGSHFFLVGFRRASTLSWDGPARQMLLQQISQTCGRERSVWRTDSLLPRVNAVHDNKHTALKRDRFRRQ